MRTPYAVAFMLILLLAGTYMYTAVEAVCKAPLSYRIGDVDDRFGITEDEILVAIYGAESVWEQATGRNLFTYDEEGELVVNFIFDERQEFAEAEIDFREKLNEQAETNSSISDTYAELVAQYEGLEFEYKGKVASYEQHLASYNATVSKYNAEGGAPPSVYHELEEERRMLDSELASLNSLGKQLNTLVDKINTLSEEGNQLVEEYNEEVGQYNETFTESHEFTQGDYQGDSINIYKFIDEAELRLVLAHELGHALSLDHVAGDTSIMYDHLGAQPEILQLTEADLNEFERVCGQSTRSFIERLFILFGI